MRDARISLLLLISFVLLLSSFLVLCIWGYRFYNKRDLSQATFSKTRQARQDSLLTLYDAAIGKLEEKLVHTTSAADSLEQNLSGRVREYYRLKSELTTLLQTATTDEDFAAARKKIEELQKNIQALRRTNQDISNENTRLYDLLSQMQASQQNSNSLSPESRTVPETRARLTASTTEPDTETEVPEPTETVRPTRTSAKIPTAPAVYSATDINLEKISGKTEALQLVGSFAIRNNPQITTNDDLMIVVIQPNGKVLQKSAWESGTFQTTAGKKIYSCKMRIENPQGTIRKVTFSLNGDKNLTGNYSLEIYHKGWLIGNISKRV